MHLLYCIVGLLSLSCLEYMGVLSTEKDYLSSTKNETMAASLMSRILNKSDSRIRPYIYGPPVEVQCDFFVASFGSINAVDMDFQVDVYFRQRWEDHRLAFNEQETPVILPAKSIEKIWVPDLFFPNEKSADYHDVTVQNQVVKIYPNGTVRYSSRITLKLNCPMVLKNFPMDYQDCYIKISSYSYGDSDVILSWLDNTPVEMDETPLPQFILLNTSSKHCVLKYKTGTFSCLMVEFHLKRQFGYYLLQAYVPSMLIVILSWVSFWIHRDAVPARITLGVTTVLTMATQLSGSRGTTITVSYAKALDVWYAFCMIIVFSALIEYAFVNSLTRMEIERRKKKQKELNEGCGVPESPKKENNKPDSLQTTDIELRPINEENNVHANQTAVQRHVTSFCHRCLHLEDGEFTADGVDKTARIIFPLIFGLFNLVYWIYYSQPVVYLDVI